MSNFALATTKVGKNWLRIYNASIPEGSIAWQMGSVISKRLSNTSCKSCKKVLFATGDYGNVWDFSKTTELTKGFGVSEKS